MDRQTDRINRLTLTKKNRKTEGHQDRKTDIGILRETDIKTRKMDKERQIVRKTLGHRDPTNIKLDVSQKNRWSDGQMTQQPTLRLT